MIFSVLKIKWLLYRHSMRMMRFWEREVLSPSECRGLKSDLTLPLWPLPFRAVWRLSEACFNGRAS